VEKFGTARQVTDDKIIWHMRFVCWLAAATNTHSEYVILRLSIHHGKNGYANAPQGYVHTYTGCNVYLLIAILYEARDAVM
jgi:hypothetical protein